MIKLSVKDESTSAAADQIFSQLWSEQGLRTTTADIEIVATQDAVALNGRVRTGLLRRMADRLARSSLNGWQLHNNLVADDQMAMDLAARLASDARTADANLRIEVYFGSVVLVGAVQSDAQRAVVLELVRQAPHVTRVEDHLTLAR
ncbi:MAG: BON domain-containing protein [Anaerolinea sp.]|nr:BON domain-containing protein [Anaerolinea sp.]HRI56748.1 BON domain-containing protein [Anaerolineae bacterium]